MKNSRTITPQESIFSQEQSWELERFAIDEISAIGNVDLLRTTKVGLLCSMRCPAKIVLKTQDYVKSLGGKGTLVSGFHSPVEMECLRLLFRENSSAIVCPAGPIDSLRIPEEWEAKIEKGKLLVLSMFPKAHKRLDARLAYQRNKFVAVIADRMFIPFADKGGKTLELIRFMVSKRKSVSAFDVPENRHLFALGVQRI